jgi:NTP pyrophosphatase (non-canonical NTP hydrolase)
MEAKKYLEESEKTLSAKYHYDTTHLGESEVYYALTEFINSANALDVVKKRKYYGKPTPSPFANHVKPAVLFKREPTGSEKVLHAVLGVASEAGELCEAILKDKYYGESVDIVNVKEEVGDLMWYIAIILREFNLDLHEVMQNNIDKLKARYGDKFSEERAINRDIEKERKILDQGENKKTTI